MDIIWSIGKIYSIGLVCLLRHLLAQRINKLPHAKDTMISHASMIGFALLISGSFPIGTVISNRIDPVSLTFMRFLLAASILGISLVAVGKMQRQHFKKPWRFILLGACFSFYFVFMFEALKTAPPVVAASIFTLLPFLAILLDFIIFRKRAGIRLVFYLVLGALGTSIVIFKGAFANLVILNLDYGEILFFAGTMIHAAYAVLVPKMRDGEPAEVVTFAVMAGATVVLCMLFPYRILATDWMDLDTDIYASLLYLSVFASIFSLILLTKASEHLTSGHFTAYTFSTPFWVAILDYTFLGHPMEAYVFWGGALIFVSLVLLFLHSAGSSRPSRSF